MPSPPRFTSAFLFSVDQPNGAVLSSQLQRVTRMGILMHLAEKLAENGHSEQVVQDYQRALHDFTKDTTKVEEALMHNKLGVLFFQSRNQHFRQNQEKGLSHMETAWEIIQHEIPASIRQIPPSTRRDWSEIPLNLGIFLAHHIAGPEISNLNRAIACYQSALDIIHQNDHHSQAIIHINLGDVHQSLNNDKEAITYYRKALTVCTREYYPQRWAHIHYHLGILSKNCQVGDKRENINKAVLCHRNALEESSQEGTPNIWATINLNLGNAIRAQVATDKLQSVEESIKCYENALKVWKRERDPLDWASAQAGLGNSYIMRVAGNRLQNLEDGIKYHRRALEVWTRGVAPRNWARTNASLGQALHLLSDMSNKQENVRKALKCFRNALEVWTETDAPLDWSKVQVNTGMALVASKDGNEKQNLEDAIMCYKKSLAITTRETSPYVWATTLLPLAYAYRIRIEGDRVSNIQEAKGYINSALEVLNESSPEMWLKARTQMAILTIQSEDISSSIEQLQRAVNALDYFKSLIEAGILFVGTLDQEYSVLRNILVSLYIHMSDYEKALSVFDHGKAFVLQGMLSDVFDVARNMPDDERERYEEARTTLRRLNYELDMAAGQGERRTEVLSEFQRQKQVVDDIVNRYSGTSQALSGLNEVSVQHMKEFLQRKEAIAIVFAHTQVYEKLRYGDYSTRLQAFSIHDNEVKFHIAGAELQAISLEEQLRLFTGMQNMTEERRNSERSFLRSFGMFVSDILRDRLGVAGATRQTKRLVVVPQRYLSKVPFSAVPMDVDGNGVLNSCLGEAFNGEVWLNPSLTIAVRIDQRTEATTSHASFQVVSSTCPTLPLREQHNKVIETFGNSNVVNTHTHVSNPYPPRQNIKQCDEVKECHILHLTCHGKFANGLNANEISLNSSTVLSESGLLFGDASREQALLGMTDVWTMRLDRCELASVVACSGSAVNVLSSNDENLSVSSAMLVAGARNVLCAPWAVDELAAVAVISRLYDARGERGQSFLKTLASRLWTAQKWLRDLQGEELFEQVTARFDEHGIRNVDIDPTDWYTWAAFALLGPPVV